MSSASAASQAWFSRPRARSTSSAEPTFRTMRRNADRVGAHGCQSPSCGGRSASARAPSIDGEHGAQNLRHALPRDGGEHERLALRRPLQAGDLLLQGVRIERVGLRERDDLGLVGEAVAVGLELVADGAVGPAGMFARAVDEVEQHAAALDMAEEAVAEAGALVRSLDQAGDVGEHEFARRPRGRRRGPDGAS